MKAIIFLLCVTWVFSCSDDESSSGRNYQIPSFAVHPLSGGGLPEGLASVFDRNPNSRLEYLVLAPINFFFPSAHAQAINCDEEVENWNTAPQTHGNAASIEPKDLVERFYAMAIFYDCHIRERALQFGIGESEHEEPSGAENAGERVTILSSRRIGDNPEHLTEFISWTDLPESQNVRGRMVNKYLQEDNGIFTKTRVDLEIENGARRVESLLQDHAPSRGDIRSYMKAGFRESNPNDEGVFQQQEVWGRYFDTTTEGKGMAVQVRAVMRMNSGLSVELKRCNGKDADCSSASAVITHYDSSGNGVSDGGGRTLPTKEVVSFYGVQSEAEFFNPEFNLANAGVE